MAILKTVFQLSKILILGSLQRLVSRIKSLITGSEPPPTAQGLTVLCPIVNGGNGQESCAMRTRDRLQDLPLNENSPMAKVPNTYLCRFYVLNDVFYESSPAREEHLKSKYLVFSTNYHGELETYLKAMWDHAEKEVRDIWQNCVAFDQVNSAADFVGYMKKCQVRNHLFFNGSNSDSLEEQLKSLYLKQEFSRFVYENQGKSPADLQQAFQAFVARTEPGNLNAPTWVAGAEDEMVKS
jgi:hypothetical protein